MPTDQTCWVCGAQNASFQAAPAKPARDKSTKRKPDESSAAEAIIDADPDTAHTPEVKAQPSASKVAVPRRAKVTLTRIAEEAAEAQRTGAQRTGTMQARPATTFKPTKLKGAPRYIGVKPAPAVPPILIFVPLAALAVIAALAAALLNRPAPAAVDSAVATVPTADVTLTPNIEPVLPIIGTTDPLPTLPPTPVVTIILPTPTIEQATAIPTQIVAPTPVPPTPVPTLAASPIPTVLPTATAAATSLAARTYTVLAGDTCGKLAKQFGITVESIITTNALAANCPLSVDQKLILPVGAAATPTAARITPTVAATAATAAATETPIPAGTASGKSYVVKPGDSCFVIARDNGITVEALIAANGLDSRCLLRAGATIVIP